MLGNWWTVRQGCSEKTFYQEWTGLTKTVLHNEHPTVRQMHLDPRTKILLCLTVTFVMLSSDGMGIMRYVQPCVAAIPVVFLMVLRKPLIVENICCQGSVTGYEFYFRSNVRTPFLVWVV